MGFPRPERYTLQCEWGQCRDVFELMDDFYYHLDQHFWSYVNMVAAEGGTTYECQWCECVFVTTNGHDLVRHLYFHGFHTKVKWLGYLKHSQCKAGPCHTHQTRNIIPELPDGFRCCWERCYVVSDIADKFYDHVCDHAVMSDPEKLPNGKTGFKCHWEGCDYEYETGEKRPHLGRHKLKGHLTTHTQERCFACPWCGNLYVNKTKLIDHFTRQIGVEDHNFQCTHCSRTFASERILKDHMRHHVNHYQCPKCAMTCPNPSALKHHMRYKHSSERPFPCEFCDYRSKEPHDMEKHMELHQADITYQCEMAGCGYEVRSLQNLHYHYRVKHGVGDGKYYACHLCGIRYGTGHQLTNHLRRTHHFQWPPGHCRFRYKECEDGFFRLQIFRYESIDISRQLSMDAINVSTNCDQSQENVPSTSTDNQCNEATSRSPAVPNKMNVKKRKISSADSKDVVFRRVSTKPKRITATRKSSHPVVAELSQSNIENGLELEELPMSLYHTSNLQSENDILVTPDDNVSSCLNSTAVQHNLSVSTCLQSWLSTGNVANIETSTLGNKIDSGISYAGNFQRSLPLQEVVNIERNQTVKEQPYYSKWIKACSVNLIRIDSPVFPNHHKICSLHPSEKSVIPPSPNKPLILSRNRNRLQRSKDYPPATSYLCENSTKHVESRNEPTVQLTLNCTQTSVADDQSASLEECNSQCGTGSNCLQTVVVEDQDATSQQHISLDRTKSSCSKMCMAEDRDTSPVADHNSQNVEACVAHGTDTSPETCDGPVPSEGISRLSDSYLEEHPKVININGKQVTLSHIEDSSPVEVKGETHFLVSGKDEESGNYIYCLVKASLLEAEYENTVDSR